MKCSKLAAKDFVTSEFHQDTWNRYLTLALLSAHISGNSILEWKLWRSYKHLQYEIVILSATILGIICRREYSLTADANTTQLLSGNKVSVALDRLTLMNKLDTTSVIPYYVDWNCALWEVHFTFGEVDSLFLSFIKSEWWMIGQGSTYWGNASHTFEGSSWLFSAYQWLFTWNYDC